MGTTPERQKILARRWYLANREKTITATKQWRKANPAKRREMHRRWKLKKLGTSPEQVLSMWKAQGRRCAICRTMTKMGVKNEARMACVDHCHRTGKVRGILCNQCNRALGMFNDRVSILRAAAHYLES